MKQPKKMNLINALYSISPVNNILKSLFYLLIFSTYIVLNGCATAPTYISPLTDEYIQLKASKRFSSLSIGVILSKNTKATIQYIEERNKYSKIKSHLALINFDSQYVIKQMNKILSSRFNKVVQLNNINEAKNHDVDLCMLLDYRLNNPAIKGKPSLIILEGMFLDLNGKIIDTLYGKYEKIVLHKGLELSSPKGGRFKEVADYALIAFFKELDNSSKISVFKKNIDNYYSTTKTLKVHGEDAEQEHIKLKSFDIKQSEDIPFGNYHALVIGNNNYKYIDSLKTAINDARSVADILQTSYGFKVKLILDGTRGNILDSLDTIRSKLTSHDNLLIYYAGHGYFDEESERGYWLPIDAKDTRKADWISNIDITDTLKAIRAKHVIVVADSCYSGTLTRSIKVKLRSSEYISRIAQKKSRTVLTSGGLEPVIDSGGGNHSVFAKAFLDALKENTGVMDGTLLFGKIRRPVMVNSPQTPQYSDIRFAGHDGGDFLFVRKKR